MESVLVVSDAKNATELVDRLNATGLRAATRSTSGADARSLAKTPPELLLIDVDSPGFDPIELCRQLKEAGSGFNGAVFLFSEGETYTPAQITDLECGADGYLPGEIDESMIDTLKSVLVDTSKILESAPEITICGLPYPAILIDLKGKISSLNEPARALIGSNKENAVGMLFNEIFYLLDLDKESRIEDPLGEVLERGSLNAYLRMPDVTDVSVCVSAGSVKGVDGRALCGVLLLVPTEIAGAQIPTNAKSERLDDLAERVKELQLLHKVARILQDHEKEPSVLFDKIVAAIPAAWRFPDVAAARIIIGSDEWATRNFADAPLKQSVEFSAGGMPGSIEVVYLEERPTADKGPFLDEEGKLLLSLSKMLRLYFDRKSVEDQQSALMNQMQLLLESTGEGIYGTDRDGQCTFINSAGARMLGYQPEELIGRPMHETIHHSGPDGKPNPQKDCTIYGVLQSGVGCRVRDDMLWRCDGTSFPVEYSAYPLREGEDIVGTVVTFVDNTESKQAQETLRKSEDRFRAIFQEAGVGISLHDIKGQILECNTRLAEMLGYSRDELTGKNISDMTHPEDLTTCKEKIGALASGEIDGYRLEKRYLRRGGELMWGRVNMTAVRLEDGSPDYVISMLEDITAEKLRAAERKKWEEAQSRMTAILNNTPDFVGISTVEGKILFVNRAGRAMLGIKEDEDLSEVSIYSCCPEWANDRILAPAVETVMKKEVWAGENTLLSRKGTEIPVSQVILAHKSSNGEVEFLSTIARDMTESQKASEALAESERRYRTLACTVPGADFYLMDKDMNFLLANGSEMRRHGLSSETFEGKRLREALDSETAALLEPVYSRALAGDEAEIQLEFRGEIYRIRTVPIRNESGEVYAAMGVSQNITQQLAAQKALETSEDRFRTMVQSGSDLIGLLSEEGQVRYVSPSVEKVLGYLPEELLGSQLFDLVSEEELAHAKRQFASVRTERQVLVGPYRWKSATGEWKWLESTFSDHLDDPSIEAIVVNARDVSAQKEYEANLIAAKERAEELVQLKTALLANMSHEIRTPLTGIIGFAQILADEISDKHKSFAELIGRSGERLLETLNSVLDLASLEAGTMTNRSEIIAIKPVAEEVSTLLTPLANDKGILMEVFEETPDVYIGIDPTSLRRILNNLVSNAIKFTTVGGVAITIRADLEEAFIQLRDTGVGIEESFIPHIFDAFRQESSGLTRTHEGVGLGLTITKRLVEAANGSIQVESVKGKGSTFLLTFPRIIPEGADEGENSDTDAERPQSQGKSALVVDNSADARLLLNRLLEPFFDVHLTPDPEAALTAASRSRFDVALIDLADEGPESGFVTEMRRLPGYESTPLIAVSAHALPGDRERFIEAGFDGYLGKPFSRRQLFNAIEEVLQSSTVKDQ